MWRLSSLSVPDIRPGYLCSWMAIRQESWSQQRIPGGRELPLYHWQLIDTLHLFLTLDFGTMLADYCHFFLRYLYYPIGSLLTFYSLLIVPYMSAYLPSFCDRVLASYLPLLMRVLLYFNVILFAIFPFLLSFFLLISYFHLWCAIGRMDGRRIFYSESWINTDFRICYLAFLFIFPSMHRLFYSIFTI